MNFNKILQNTEYSTKQVLGYYILAFREVNNNGDNQRIEEYVKSIVNQIENIDVKDILKNIDINIIANFPFYHTINNEELLAYGIVLFHRLLSTNTRFCEKDIIKEMEIIMRLDSSRTVLNTALDILNKKSIV